MNKTSIVILTILIILAMILSCQKQESRDSYEIVLQMFQNPPSEYRSAPLWVWNDEVTTTQIEEQLKDFKEKGIGGVFIHPRPGLITPYLSEEWLSLCRHAVTTGKNLDMKIWIYDENSYPSGFAGGHVPHQMSDAVRKSLVMKKVYTLTESFEKEPFIVLQKTSGKKFQRKKIDPLGEGVVERSLGLNPALDEPVPDGVGQTQKAGEPVRGKMGVAAQSVRIVVFMGGVLRFGV